MKRVMIFMALVAIGLAGCGDGKGDAAKQLEAVVEESGPIVDLSDEDMALQVQLPFGHLVDEGTALWNEEFGRMEVNAGPDLAIAITEEPGDMARFKADLDRDLLRTHTIVEETPKVMIYRSQYPDEDLVFLHFHQIITVDGRTFVIEDMPEGKYNEKQIRAMSKAVTPKDKSPA